MEQRSTSPEAASEQQSLIEDVIGQEDLENLTRGRDEFVHQVEELKTLGSEVFDEAKTTWLAKLDLLLQELDDSFQNMGKKWEEDAAAVVDGTKRLNNVKGIVAMLACNLTRME